MLDDEKLFEKVFLVGILTRNEGESLDDVLMTLADTGMFTPDEGRKVLEALHSDGLVDDNGLTMMGVEIAKKAREEFAEAGRQINEEQQRAL